MYKVQTIYGMTTEYKLTQGKHKKDSDCNGIPEESKQNLEWREKREEQ